MPRLREGGEGVSWLQYHPEPVTLHSGGRSHYVVDADAIFADEELRAAVIEAWLRVIAYVAGRANIIAIPRGGLRWAEELQRQGGMHWRSAILEEMPNAALARLLRVDVGEGDWLIVVDDVATTGASLRVVPEPALRLCVVDRSETKDGLAGIHHWAHIPLPLVKEER